MEQHLHERFRGIERHVFRIVAQPATNASGRRDIRPKEGEVSSVAWPLKVVNVSTEIPEPCGPKIK